MRILYFNVIEQNKGWGAEYFVNKAFNNLGVETYCIDYRKNRYNLDYKILELNQTFDALLLQRGDYFPLSIIRSFTGPKIYWATELVKRQRDQDHLLKSGLFDFIFVHTIECKNELLRRGWIDRKKISVLLNGFDPDVQYSNETVNKNIDVLFIGNSIPRRDRLIKAISQEVFVTYKKAFGDEMTQLYNRAKIVLNLHASDFPDTETRVFEVLGTNSFLISEILSEDNPFIPDTHYIEARNKRDIINKIKYYLVNPAQREYIANKGYIEAIHNHNYLRRAEQILSSFEEIRKGGCSTSINQTRLTFYRNTILIYRLYFNLKILFDKIIFRFNKMRGKL